MTAVPSITDLIHRVPSWVGRAVEWQRLEGGLSHHIYRVDVDRVPYVLRVLEPAVSAAGLGIAPEREIANTVLAAQTVGAQVYEILPDVPAVVIEYLPGRTLGPAEVRRPAIIPSIATACRRLHAGPAFGNDFDIFAKRLELLDVCARHDLPLPDGYTGRDADVSRLRAALAVRPLPSVPCHNDLLAANLIATGDGVRIIDYQLSGNNDPAFELGDIAAEAGYDPDLAGLLTDEYFAGADETLRARVRLFQIASDITWTLWFTVHHGLFDSAGFDYAAEAAGKWGQAQRALDDPGFGHLLAAVTGTTPHP